MILVWKFNKSQKLNKVRCVVIQLHETQHATRDTTQDAEHTTRDNDTRHTAQYTQHTTRHDARHTTHTTHEANQLSWEQFGQNQLFVCNFKLNPTY